jgi:uncharacterized protein DUF4383
MLQRLTFAYAALFLVVAAVGFVIHGTHSEPATNLFGLFPVNGLHNFVHLLIGVAGVAAVMLGAKACRAYARTVGVVYSAVGVLGFFSPTAFGLMPIGGADIALHLATGAIALYLGFSKRFAVDGVGFTPRPSRVLHREDAAGISHPGAHTPSPRVR